MNGEAAFWILVNVMALFYGAFVSGLFTGLRFFEALAEHLGMEDAEGDAS